MSGEDDGLRMLAITQLGEHSPPAAREALEDGALAVEPDVLAWEGSHGTVHAHRVVLCVVPEVRTRLVEAPSVVDALTAAIAAAIGLVAGNALAELVIVAGDPSHSRTTPYRGRL